MIQPIGRVLRLQSMSTALTVDSGSFALRVLQGNRATAIAACSKNGLRLEMPLVIVLCITVSFPKSLQRSHSYCCVMEMTSLSGSHSSV